MKRIPWCVCEWPWNEPLEAIVALVIEGYLEPAVAEADLDREMRMLEDVAALPLATSEPELENQAFFDAVRSDLRIASTFVAEVATRNPPGVIARRQILEQIIAQEREGQQR